MYLAQKKARAYLDRLQSDELLLTADTIVWLDGQVLGKPKDEEDAFAMLSLLSGQVHHVYTGVTFVFIDKSGRTGEYSFFEQTGVEFYPMTEGEIRHYIASGEPMDKAGAYGIQGKCAIYIRRIQGDYYNVVGLPIGRLYQELQRLGFDPDLC